MANPTPCQPPDSEIDRLVDADEFAAHVDQRPAAVAGVEQRVGLEQVGRVFAARAGPSR